MSDTKSRDKVIERGARLDKSLQEFFKHTSALEWQAVPFLSTFEVLNATSSRPRSTKLSFLDNGARLIHLQPTGQTMHPNEKLLREIIKLEKLDLHAHDIPDYLRFLYQYLAHMTLIRDANDVEWIPDDAQEEDDQMLKDEALSKMMNPMRVSPVGTSGFAVVTSVVNGAELVELEIAVETNGKIKIKKQRTVMDYIPVIEYMECSGVHFGDEGSDELILI